MRVLDQLATIAWKETREVVTNKGLVLSGIILAAWFSLMAGLGIGEESITQQMQLDNSLFYMAALIGLFVAYIYAGQTFLREKQSGIVETLLCAPVSLRTIWLGKAIGVALPSSVLSWLSAASIIFMVNHRSAFDLIPSSLVLGHVLFSVPIFIVAAIALLGFGQLMLGMRENMIINMLTVLVLFGALATTRLVVDDTDLVSTTTVVGFAVGSIVLLLVISALGRFLSRERIVRTIS